MGTKRKSRRLIVGGVIFFLCALPIYLFIAPQWHAFLNAALLQAVYQRNARRVDALAFIGANPNVRGSSVYTSYHALSWYRQLQDEALEALSPRAKGAPAPPAPPGPTVLMIAAYNGDVATVRTLLVHGASANRGGAQISVLNNYLYGLPLADALDGSSVWPVHKVVNDPATLQIVGLLLAHGANPNGICRNSFDNAYTVLSVAVQENQTGAALLLLRHGADPNNGGDIAPLDDAVDNINVASVKMLLKYGAVVKNMDLLSRLKFGDPASLQIGRTLLCNGENINARDGLGETPLFAAEETHDPNLIAFMIKSGANPNIKDNQGQTALTYGSPDEVALIRAIEKPGTPIPHNLLARKRRIMSYAPSF